MIKKILFTAIFLLYTLFAFANLKDIQQNGTIRIGITGDYQPFSWYDPKTQQFSGLDIDLAKELARNLHVSPIFVKTTWPTLSADLQANKFDIAMGGISISAAREQRFMFSNPYLFDSKVAVMRCSDKLRFASIEQLNKPEIRVIENRGGTNETFAQQNLNNSNLKIINSNQGIFEYLIDHKADVMITDQTEAIYQKKLHPVLCIVYFDSKVAPPIAKAVMLPSNAIELQQSINAWLYNMQSSRKLSKLVNQWLG